MPKTEAIWRCDYGTFVLPDNFPHHVIRKDGWFDRRFKKDRLVAQAYIKEQTDKMRAQYESGELSA